MQVRCIVTSGGERFVTPMSVAALSENPVYQDLWSLKDESEMGHIRLSREADVIVVAPASANMLAKMANGLADDLASTTLLAADKPILIAPAMNPEMWQHPATRKNIETLLKRGVDMIGPADGDMACGETGTGRMSEADEIFAKLQVFLDGRLVSKPLKGKRAIVTSGPTHEPIDPVRFIGNYSSGKQGHAIAAALKQAGAEVTLVTGPVCLKDPVDVNVVRVETAEQMHHAAMNALPADIAVCAAAPADWRSETAATQKMKKDPAQPLAPLNLVENPDILRSLSQNVKRPSIVIGFAAETENLLDHARAKLERKGCDWLLANNVAAEKVFGATDNHVYLVKQEGEEEWSRMAKTDIASRLTDHIINHFEENSEDKDEQRLTSNTNQPAAAE